MSRSLRSTKRINKNPSIKCLNWKIIKANPANYIYYED